MRWLLLFLGGGLGATARFAVSSFVMARVGLPWGTLAVNVVGCLAIGFLAAGVETRGVPSASGRLFLITGLLGGFTTFSAFGLETWQLLQARAIGAALAYSLGSVVAGLLAVIAGWSLGRGA